jgi:molecular chaperone DnaJ
MPSESSTKTSPSGVAPGAAGDVYVIVTVEEPALFRRRGPDLLVEVPVSYAEAVLGADLTVPTLDGTTTIRVPAGTPTGRSFRLAGRGLPGDGGAKGDLHVKVQVEIPTALDEEAKRLLQAYAERVGAAAHPQRRAWGEAMRGRR